MRLVILTSSQLLDCQYLPLPGKYPNIALPPRLAHPYRQAPALASDRDPYHILVFFKSKGPINLKSLQIMTVDASITVGSNAPGHFLSEDSRISLPKARFHPEENIFNKSGHDLQLFIINRFLSLLNPHRGYYSRSQKSQINQAENTNYQRGHNVAYIYTSPFIIQNQMCSLCAEGACCCCACCCKECVESVQKGLGKEKSTKICYLFLVIVFTVPAIAILFFINSWNGFKSYFSWMQCPQSSGGNFECIGPSTVFRISLSFLALFVVMLILMLCRNRISMIINEGLFFVKYIFVLGVFIGFLFVGTEVFNQYADVTKYVSILFMIIQSIILIDLFYLAGIKLVKRYDAGETSCGLALVILTILCEAVAVGLNIYGYTLFSMDDGCGNTLWVNIVTSILLAVLPILQCCNFNKQNSLLTTALVSAYISYLALICQFSYGDQCTSRMTVKSIAADIIVSTFFFFLTTYGTIMGGSGQMKISEGTDVNQAMGVAPTDPNSGEHLQAKKQHKYQEKQEKEEEKQETEETNLAKYSQGWGWVKWHFYMCIASMYIGMLITNWTSASLTTGTLISNGFGFWVRVIISWAVALIYVWTLIAPKIFPDRDFTVA